MTESAREANPGRLARRLGLVDSVVIGLGSMVGAGVFVAIGPAAAAAGAGLLLGLGIAAVVAYANATSSAQLAAAHPVAGGTYAYGRAELGPFWGFLAGWGFVVGKTASLTAMALTVGVYTVPGYERPIAAAAVVAMATVNFLGVKKTASLTKWIVVVVVSVLTAAVVAGIGSTTGTLSHFEGIFGGDLLGSLRAAGFMFFAFAGYARIATLGEEVVNPSETIPKAIPLALIISLGIYTTVSVAALYSIGPEGLAASQAPLATAASQDLAWMATLVGVGAAIASLGVLLSLLAGVSRTMFAMAREHDFPGWLAVVHLRYKTPYRAEALTASVVVAVVLFVDLRGAIGFSSFTILTYYAIANLAALSQTGEQRRWPRALQILGLVGCIVLAFSLPASSIAGGVAVLSAGSLIWMARRLRSRRAGDR